MKTLSLLLSSLALALIPVTGWADGMFVAPEPPRFVWDKHKDINEPTQKAIIVYDKGEEDMILQVKYEGRMNKFGWLIPVPSKPAVQKGSMKCFYELSQLTQQRFDFPNGTYHGEATMSLGFSTLSASSAMPPPPPPVKVVETKTIGAYEIAVLSARDSGALKKWLDDNHYDLPQEKADVIDSYIQQNWYFIAVKIDLDRWFTGFSSVSSKLASGELNPLQISFASDRCVFPLKISSANGTPSEVQLYVLSPEPLLERSMLEKKLPLIYSNDVARAEKTKAAIGQMEVNRMAMQGRFMGGYTPYPSVMQQALQRRSEMLTVNPNDLLTTTKISDADLPDCRQWIPRLAGKSWWLTKQTWTFQPADMHDLHFEPAIPYFANLLGTKYGYYAVDSLERYDSDAVPGFLAALKGTNSVARVNAALAFDRHYGYPHDAGITTTALQILLDDPEPQVRMAGIEILADNRNWSTNYVEPLMPLLRDPDAGVRFTTYIALLRHRDDLEPSLPRFKQLLKDPNPDVQFAGIYLLQHMGYEIPRDNLLACLNSTNTETVAMAYSMMKRQGDNLTDEQALPLLQSPEPTGRMLGLDALGQNAEKQSVELALPFLADPDEIVRLKASLTLRVLTGQQFTADESGQWIKWWDKNKATLVVQLHPEELRTRFRRMNPPLTTLP